MPNQSLNAAAFLASADESTLHALLDHLPDVQYWIKDAQGRYVHVNRGFLDNYAFDDVAQVLGKTDYDIAPPYLVDAWVKDDQQVLQGHELINHIELVGHADRSAGWYMTTKLPLRSRQGDILGTTGITLAIKGPTERLWPYAELDAVVRHIRENIDRPISVSELAQLASLSVSALERKFKKHLRVTPMQYIKRLRISFASQALVQTDLSINEIAHRYGFCDHSYMSKEFRRVVGMTPREYRKLRVARPTRVTRP